MTAGYMLAPSDTIWKAAKVLRGKPIGFFVNPESQSWFETENKIQRNLCFATACRLCKILMCAGLLRLLHPVMPLCLSIQWPLQTKGWSNKDGFQEAPPCLTELVPARMEHKGFTTQSPSAACAPAFSVLVCSLKKFFKDWGMKTHIALLCLLSWGLAVEAKSSMGLLQRSKRFSQFKTVRIGEVWNDLKSSKVVSYTLTRDLTVVGELLHSCLMPPSSCLSRCSGSPSTSSSGTAPSWRREAPASWDSTPTLIGESTSQRLRTSSSTQRRWLET